MKKKGLIVATIVMVLVLAVSLSTATYAWFSEITETTITDINFSVGAGSDVIIGIKADGVYNASATEAAFFSNNTEYDGSAWSGSTNGFGASIDTGLDLGNITKAIGTGKIGSTTAENVVNSGWNLADGNTVIKANGAATNVDATSAVAAVKNGYQPSEGDAIKGDYLDVVIGVKPAKSGLKTITLNLTVNPNTGSPVLGMNAAIHAIYEIDQEAGTSYTAGNYNSANTAGEIDVYGDKHYGTSVNAEGMNTASTYAAQNLNAKTDPLNAGWKNIPIVVATNDAGLPVDDFYQIHLIVFIAGYDEDCTQSAMGVGAVISLNFTAEAISST